MELVVDASVAVKWLVREENSDQALRLFEGPFELCAPRLMASEVANALSRKARLGEIRKSQAVEWAAAISEMGVTWAVDESICLEAVRLSLELDHPVYDCLYLALAQRLGTTMVTADVRFANAVAETGYGHLVVTLDSLVLD